MNTVIEFEGLRPISSDDVFIAVMGVTGSGKSTFIEHCTKTPERLSGHGLSSCTSTVSIHTTEVLGRSVHLLDTPGFNDSRRGDGETLQELAFWLTAAYERDIQISGIIYLHCITDNRFQGSAVRALDSFKKMCGVEAFCGVVVATTMWDRVTASDLEKAENRHEELHQKVRMDIIQQGGKLVRLSAVEIDAAKILRHFVEKNQPFSLAFQRQLVDEKRLIYQTDVGEVLFDHLGEKLQSLKTLSDEIEQKIVERAHGVQTDNLRELSAAISEMTENIRSISDDIERTKVAVKDFCKKWQDRLNDEDERLLATARTVGQRLEEERHHRQQSKSNVYVSSVRAESRSSHVRLSSSIDTPSRSTHQSPREFQSARLRELEKEQQALAVQMGRRLNRRYTSHGRGSKRIEIIGATLAAGQLVAALACVVM